MNPLTLAKQLAYSSEETLMFTYECARKLKDKPGVFVECGVAAGAQIIAMRAGAPNKKIFAFDSFEGIPLPSNRDDQMPGIRKLQHWEQMALPDPGKQKLASSGATVVSEDDFWVNIERAFGSRKNIKTVPGWFETTTPGFDEDISFLRLDGDLYNSTLVCLKNMFPKMLMGGIVVIDDWQLKGCKDAVEDYFNSVGYKPEMKFVSNIAYFFV